MIKSRAHCLLTGYDDIDDLPADPSSTATFGNIVVAGSGGAIGSG